MRLAYHAPAVTDRPLDSLSAATPSSPPDRRFTRMGARVLAALTLINMLNYVDRYVVPPIFESLRRDPRMHQPNDAALGWLMTGFLVVYTIASPVFGRLGDRLPRLRLIAIGVALWSLATAAGGFAASFGALLTTRAAVGIGEAAYASIAPAILSDYYAPDARGRIMSIFYCAIPVGSALGYVLGGLIDAHVGWRAVFFVAGAPGLALALLVLALDDPPRGGLDRGTVATAGADASGRATPASFAAVCRALARNRTYALTSLGYAAYTFALGGIAAWLPSFFERVRGVPHAEAASVPGAILVLTGFAGTFAGGWLGDRWLARTPRAHLWVTALTTIAAVPAAVVLFTADSPAVFWSATAVAELLLFASTGLVNAITVNAVPAAVRATAMAVQIFLIHAIGDVPSPVIIGALSDAFSLQRAVLVVPVAVAVAGAIWLRAALTDPSTRDRDGARVSTRPEVSS